MVKWALGEQAPGVNEEGLVRLSREGQHEAFASLVRLYQGRVYSLALRLVGDVAAAEDITQEAFLSAYKKLHLFTPGSFRAWLFRITVNACKDHLRARRHKRALSLEALQENPGVGLQSRRGNPEEHVLAQEVARVVQEGLQSLPPEQRALLLLVDQQGLAYEEAAVALNLPLGTVKSRLSRARAALRAFLLGHKELLPPEFRLE